jgi:UDP-N-acetyl-2-amino-2-deoxyglucuronate dehydrogenase
MAEVPRRLCYGMIGLGNISRAHREGYHRAAQYVRVTGVCDTQRARADAVGRETGADIYTDYRELLQRPDIDAVDIALPHSLHFEVASAAFAAGKHVYIEKPLAPTADECDQLMQLASSNNLVLAVAHHGRFVRAYLEADRLLREGALGTPRLVRTLIYGSELIYLNDPTHWRSRISGSVGGAILDSGPHSIFLLKWLFGEFETVRAFTHKISDVSEVEDNAVVAGRLKSGVLFTTQYTFTAENFFSERLEIYGSKGTLVIDQLRDPPGILYRGTKDLQGEKLESISFNPAGWKYAAQVAAAENLAKSLSRQEPFLVDTADAAYAIRVIERAYESAAQDGRLLTV